MFHSSIYTSQAHVATATADRIRGGRFRAGRNPRLTSCRLPPSLSPRVNSRHIRSLRLNGSERIDA